MKYFSFQYVPKWRINVVLQILIIMVWLVIVPFSSGLLLTKLFPEKYHSISMIFINGYFVSFAVFQSCYLFFIIERTKFKELVIVYAIAMGVISVLSLVFGWRCLKNCKMEKPSLLAILAFVFVLFQIVMGFRMQVSDGDDAFFIATATHASQSGTIFFVNPYTGDYLDSLDIRHALASIPIWLAFLAKTSGIHAAILAHSILPSFFFAVFYFIMAQIGRLLLPGKREAAPLFVMFFSLYNIFGNVSIYTTQTFLITRTWQGKSLFANLCIPLAFLILLILATWEKENGKRIGVYIAAAVVMVASAAMSSAGIIMLPALMLLGAILLSIRQKKISTLLWMLLACIPVGLNAVFMIITKLMY